MILPYKSYAFFSHTHKGQQESVPLLGKVCNVVPNVIHMKYICILPAYWASGNDYRSPTKRVVILCYVLFYRLWRKWQRCLIMSSLLGVMGKGNLHLENMLEVLE